MIASSPQPTRESKTDDRAELFQINLCSELHPLLVLVKQERSRTKNSDAAIVLEQILGNDSSHFPTSHSDN